MQWLLADGRLRRLVVACSSQPLAVRLAKLGGPMVPVLAVVAENDAVAFGKRWVTECLRAAYPLGQGHGPVSALFRLNK